MNELRGWGRRDVLRGAGLAGAGALCSVLLPGGARAADVRSAPAALGATLLRWLDGARVPKLRDLRAGWAPPCPSLSLHACPVRLNDLVDYAPVRDWTPAQPLDLRLIGFDGSPPEPELQLDVLFPAEGMRTLLPFRLAEVRAGQLAGSPQSVRAWGWDGRLPLRLGAGRGAQATGLEVEVPALPGVYLLAIARSDLALDPAALAFAEGAGGPLHRRLVDLHGKPCTGLGYFALSVSAA